MRCVVAHCAASVPSLRVVTTFSPDNIELGAACAAGGMKDVASNRQHAAFPVLCSPVRISAPVIHHTLMLHTAACGDFTHTFL